MLPIVPTTAPSMAPLQHVADVSHFATVSSSAPTLGNIPSKTVPSTIGESKVADRQPQQTATPALVKSPADATASQTLPFSLAGQGDIVLESPFSTTFLTQVLGQLPIEDSDGIVSDLVDFDFIARFSAVKYKPSGAVPKGLHTKIEIPVDVVRAALPQEVSTEALQQRASAAYDDTNVRVEQPTTAYNSREEVSLVS